MKDKTIEDKLKKAVAYEFKYRESQGITNYSTEEVICVLNEVIDEFFAWKSHNDDMKYRANCERYRMSKSIHIIPMTDTMCMLVVQALQTAPGLNSYDKLLAKNMVEGILGIVSADKQEAEKNDK